METCELTQPDKHLFTLTHDGKLKSDAYDLVINMSYTRGYYTTNNVVGVIMSAKMILATEQNPGEFQIRA